MQTKLGTMPNLKCFFLPRNNHWLKRTILVFTFILFDYLSTLVFCRAPYEEANLYARSFMEAFGVPLGLTAFVLVANLPIYITLSLDSHVIKTPFRTVIIIESFVDVIFAWFIAGLHFSGGTSWFWHAPDLMRQIFGVFLYLTMAFLFVKPHKRHYNN
jgi:hypothetical protein